MPFKAWQGISFPPPPPPQHVLTPNNIRQGASRSGHEFEGFMVWKRRASHTVQSRADYRKFETSCGPRLVKSKMFWIYLEFLVVTEHAGLLDATKSLHDTDGFLQSIFGLQFTRAWVSRRKVAIPAQPVLHRRQGNHSKQQHAPNICESTISSQSSGDNAGTMCHTRLIIVTLPQKAFTWHVYDLFLEMMFQIGAN